MGPSAQRSSTQLSDRLCQYSDGTTQIASFGIQLTGLSDSELNSSYQGSLQVGGKTVQGIGGLASEITSYPNIYPNTQDAVVSVNFYAKGIHGYASVGLDQSDSTSKAEKLATLIVSKL